MRTSLLANTWTWIAVANLGLALPYAIMVALHWSHLTSSAAASVLALGAALVFAWKRRDALVEAQGPDRPGRTLLALGAAVVLYVLSVLLDARVGIGLFFVLAIGAQIHLYAGSRGSKAFAVPLLLAALATPFPGFAHALLSQELLELTLVVAPFLVEPLVGSTTTEGYHLLFPGGELAIVEDCSGLGSLLLATPILVILFAVHGPFSMARGVLLVVCAVALVFAGNMLRVLVSAILVATSSPYARSETLHELIGTAGLLAALVALYFISYGFRRSV